MQVFFEQEDMQDYEIVEKAYSTINEMLIQTSDNINESQIFLDSFPNILLNKFGE